MVSKQERRQQKRSRKQGRRDLSGKREAAVPRSPAEAVSLAGGLTRLEQFLARRRRWIWGALFAATAALYLAAASNELGGNFGGDDVQYLLLSKALAGGLGYADLYLPDHPAHTKYPPVFPLLLAPFNWLGHYQILGVHLLICLLAAGVPLLWAGWVRRQGYSETAALGVLLLTATLPRYYQFLLHILSEVPFMFFSFLALYAMARAGSRPKPRDLVFITLAALAALFTRTAGIGLVAALGIELLRRAEFRRLRLAGIPSPIFFGAAVGLALLLWTLRNRGVGGTSLGYFQEMMLKDVYQPTAGYLSASEFAARVFRRAYLYLTVLGLMAARSVIFIVESQVQHRHVFFLLPLLLGFFSRLRRGERSAEWCFLFSVLIVISWWSFEDRFLIPLLPFASFYFILGVRKIAGAMLSPLRLPSARAGARGLTALVGLVILLQQGWITARVVRSEHTDRWEPEFSLALNNGSVWSEPVINWSKFEWGMLGEQGIQGYTRFMIMNRLAAERVPAGQVILSRKSPLTAWLTGRPSVCYLFTEDVNAQWEFLRRNRVAYAIVAAPVKEIKDLAANCPACLQPVISFQDGWPALFKVRYPDESGK